MRLHGYYFYNHETFIDLTIKKDKMKSTVYYLFIFMIMLGHSYLPAQIPTNQISGTQTFTSVSNIDASGDFISDLSVYDMLQASIRRIYATETSQELGIDATFSSSNTNPTLPLTNEPNAASFSSVIIVKVYGYDETQVGGKGNVIFGMYSTETSSVNQFKAAGWTIKSNDQSYWKKFFSESFTSTNIREGAMIAKLYSTEDPDCQLPEDGSGFYGWLAKNVFSVFSRRNEDTGKKEINYNCFLSKGKEIFQPVIVEVTVKNATLRQIAIPGLGRISAAYFPIQTPAATDIVEVKGSNYEVNILKSGLNFGHNINTTTSPPRFSVQVNNALYNGAKFTGLYGSTTQINGVSSSSSDGYLKINVKAGQKLTIALENGMTLSSDFGSTRTLETSNALSIKDFGNSSSVKNFDIWEVSAQGSARTIKFPFNASGPFVIAHAFDVGFKQNMAMPANKRKLFNRADHLEEVIVCAHRGLWNKVGSHNPVNYAGIAENTIDAYEAALANSDVDWMEFDGRRTKDGVFVSWHDEDVYRITNMYDDRECISIEDVNERDRVWVQAEDPDRTSWRKQIRDYSWSELQNLHLRDYLGCKVKTNSGSGSYVNPLKLEDAFQWVKDKAGQNKHTALSIDFKDGLNYLHELYRLILEKDLEGQVLFSLYAREYSLEDYQNEYGISFLRQLPLKPTFYEPTNPDVQYGGDLPKRLKDYVVANDNGHFIAALTINVNNDQEPTLTNLLRQTDPPAFPVNEIWYVSHYLDPYLVSIYDNLRITSPVDCDPSQHPSLQNCVNLFWRADFDWLLNNGTNGIFSDNPAPLIEFLKAKGKK